MKKGSLREAREEPAERMTLKRAMSRDTPAWRHSSFAVQVTIPGKTQTTKNECYLKESLSSQFCEGI